MRKEHALMRENDQNLNHEGRVIWFLNFFFAPTLIPFLIFEEESLSIEFANPIKKLCGFFTANFDSSSSFLSPFPTFYGKRFYPLH